MCTIDGADSTRYPQIVSRKIEENGVDGVDGISG